MFVNQYKVYFYVLYAQQIKEVVSSNSKLKCCICTDISIY